MPAYQGVTVHDEWASYFTFEKCQHVLCNAHHLRELKGIQEQTKQSWETELIALLLAAKEAKKQAYSLLDNEQLLYFEKAFNHMLAQGEQLNPTLPKEKMQEGGRNKRQHAIFLIG